MQQQTLAQTAKAASQIAVRLLASHINQKVAMLVEDIPQLENVTAFTTRVLNDLQMMPPSPAKDVLEARLLELWLKSRHSRAAVDAAEVRQQCNRSDSCQDIGPAGLCDTAGDLEDLFQELPPADCSDLLGEDEATTVHH